MLVMNKESWIDRLYDLEIGDEVIFPESVSEWNRDGSRKFLVTDAFDDSGFTVSWNDPYGTQSFGLRLEEAIAMGVQVIR